MCVTKTQFDAADTPVKGVMVRRSWQKHLLTFLMVFGPDLIVMEADNDAGAVSTYMQADGQYGLLADHVHMLISIPPKYAVSQVVGFIKGKSAIHLARTYGDRKQNYAGQNFWARGYFVSTVGRDEATIRKYIRTQEQEDQRLDQMNLWR